jgi:hypothetical protein
MAAITACLGAGTPQAGLIKMKIPLPLNDKELSLFFLDQYKQGY